MTVDIAVLGTFGSYNELFTTIALFGSGMVLGIIGIIFAISRGMTKNSEMWGLIFGSYAWLISIAYPGFGGAGLFAIGAIGITLSMIEIYNTKAGKHLVTTVVFLLMLNLILGFGSNVFDKETDLRGDLADSQGVVNGILGKMLGEYNTTYLPDNMVATKTQETQKPTLLLGILSTTVFDPIATVLAIGAMVSGLFTFMGKMIFMPVIIANVIKKDVANATVIYLIGFYLWAIQIKIYYDILMFVVNGRGR